MINRTSNPATTALTGALPFLLFLAAVLALIASLALLTIYRRAVVRSMRANTTSRDKKFVNFQTSARSNSPVPILDIAVLNDDPMATQLSAGRIYTKALRAPWRLAALYSCAGACFALVVAISLLVAAELGFHPYRLLPTFWVYAWPIVLTLSVVAASTRRVPFIVTGVYFVALLPLSLIPADGPPVVFQLVGLWLVNNLIPTLLLFMFLNGRIRAVGPLVLIFLVVMLTGSLIALAIVDSNDRLLRSIAAIGIALGLNATDAFLGLIVIGSILFGPIGWILLRWIRERYERKRISDQSIILDAIWLFFGVTYSISLVFEGPWWILSGLVAFLVYKAVTFVGFWLLRRTADLAGYYPTLLLLRVFSLGKRHERLFDALALHWRHIGSIDLIAGPDLATTTVEPHEFLDFLTGKLARRFIDSPQTLALRLAEMDMQPDQDGRFRVNDFFCHDDTWRMVLSRLVRDSNVVLMDLRGFTPQHDGCMYEITELINTVPLDQVVFVIDNTTDDRFLRQVAQGAWSERSTTSPNWHAMPAQLRLFHLTTLYREELRQLVRALCASATSAHVPDNRVVRRSAHAYGEHRSESLP